MLFTLREEHQAHLQFLKQQTKQVVQDFCQLATLHLEKGPNLKAHNSAAQKLNLSPDVIRHTIEALIFLSYETIRFKAGDEDLTITLIALGFTPELRDVISGWIQTQRSSLSLQVSKPTLPHYLSMAWRLEACLASRSLLSYQGNATVTLLLRLGTRKVALQVTPSMLRHLCATFEAALAEASSRHARRALRALK